MALILVGLPTTNSATCNYSAGNFAKPGGAQPKKYKQTWISEIEGDSTTRQTRRMEADEVQIGDLKYSWDFGSNQANGTHTFTRLLTGERNIITATVTATCEKITTHWLRTDVRTRTPGKPGTPAQGDKPAIPATPPGPWSEWKEGEESHGLPKIEYISVSGSPKVYQITVYTKPGYWTGFSRIRPDATIQEALIGSEWDSLGRQASKYQNWKNQRDMQISVSSYTSDGGWVTASLYNEMAQACGIRRRVIGGSNGDVIYASYFIELKDAVQGGN